MELNHSYCVNVISRRGTSRYGHSFVVVEKFNPDSSQYFQNYYKKLLSFNRCGEWFLNLDCPRVEIGNVVIVQIDKNKNLWARGIISKDENNILCPEIYLIDSQRFFDYGVKLKLKICPPKFAQLGLPTYNIHVNLCSNDDDGLQSAAIDMLINKNQYGELSFCFTPKSVQNDIYYGELSVNNQADDSFISLEKLLKNVHRKKYLQDISKYRQHNISIFDPFNFNYLQNIFIPRDPNSLIFIDKNVTLSYSDLNNLLENSCNSPDDFSSITDYSKCSNLSDDSLPAVQNLQIDDTSLIAQQTMNSSFSTLKSINHLLIYSSCYFEKECSPELNSVINRLYDSIIQGNDKYQESIVLEKTADNTDENKLNNTAISTMPDIVLDAVTKSACFKTNNNNNNNNDDDNNNNNNMNSTVFERNQSGIVDRKIEANDWEEKQFANINTSIKQQFDCLPELLYKHVQYQSNNNFTDFTTTQKEILSNRSIIETTVDSINVSTDDSHIWWSSDEENL